MRHETVLLAVPGAKAQTELITYVPDNFPETGLDTTRPAIIICPGGGYRFLSDREGEPVALRFAGLGYAAFVLKYHTAPVGQYPIPQRQILAAVDHVRSNAELYHVDPKAVLCMGFSAGGHLAASAGTFWNKPEVYRSLKKKSEAYRPDGLILGYPVITSGEFGHKGSFENLLGDNYEELLELVSLEKRVTRRTPPTFLWHTADDTTVPVENSLIFKAALEARGVPVEMHIYPHGVHGQSLADRTVFAPDKMWQLSAICNVWVSRCDTWIQRTFCDKTKIHRV